ncbi:MAG: universal stress protein [Acidimicrobiales bacterium]
MAISSLVRVVAGTDHTAGASFALGWATDVAASLAIDLVVATAYSDPEGNIPTEAALQHLDAITHQLMSETSSAEASNINFTLLPIIGDPATVLHELNSPDSLLVIGADSKSQTAIGPIARFVTHHLSGPLALVPGPSPPLAKAGLMVGVDGSHANDVALRWAADVARRCPCRLNAVYGDHPLLGDDYRWGSSAKTDVGERTAEEHVRLVDSEDVDIRFVNIHAKAVDALLEAVDRFQPRALVIGTRGFGGLQGNILGSVPKQLLNDPPCPIILVPH